MKFASESPSGLASGDTGEVRRTFNAREVTSDEQNLLDGGHDAVVREHVLRKGAGS